MVRRKLRRMGQKLLILLILLSAAWGATVQADAKIYTRDDAEAMAKLVWGEARGCDDTQQAAAAWCVLNRVDSALFPNTIREVVSQKKQFAGYRVTNPVDPQILALVYDVLSRWSIEDNCVGGVGRVLPKEYLFFSGNGTENRFRVTYGGSEIWDWSLPTPYREVSIEAPAGSSGPEQAEIKEYHMVYYPSPFGATA